jgi:hypothetical protein
VPRAKAPTTKYDPRKRLFSQKRDHAKRSGVDFTLKFEDIEWPTYCPVLGIPLRYKPRRIGGASGPRYCSPSFDRIRPSQGYVPGNVRVISQRANTLKNNATPDELRRVIAYMEDKL